MQKPLNRGFPVSARLDTLGIQIGFSSIPPSQFVDAFSHETIGRCAMQQSFISYTWQQLLERYNEPNSGRIPSGLILHPARVGSTLQCRLLRCIDGVFVYSEPPVINDLLMPPVRCSREQTIVGLRLIADLLGAHAQLPFIMKLRSWNTLFASAILAAFPSTNWVFAMRDPLEVAVSIQQRPPTWMRARASANNPFLPFAEAHGPVNTPENYLSSMFAAFCAAIRRAWDNRGTLVEYADLPGAVWNNVAPHFGLQVASEQIKAMEELSRFDAKSAFGKARIFLPDSDRKRATASLRLRSSIDAIAVPALASLKKVASQYEAVPSSL